MPLSLSLESICQLSGNTDAASTASGAAGISYSSKNHNAYGSPDIVTGWMYLNEQGQMCGPYIQSQLSEGLSTGFLPDELPVYPVMNGALLNPVPLKFFKQYPDHVASGFTHVSRSTSDVTASTDIDPGSVLLTSDQQSHVNQTSYNSDVLVSASKSAPGATVFQQQCLSWDERCWLYLDGYGRSSGPHTLSELYGWHQYGYLHNSVMIRHSDNNCSPFTLMSLINSWRKQSSIMTANETGGMVELISEEIGTQLHDGVMKAARRSVLDEIIGNVIVDFAAMKKGQKQSKSENVTEDLRNSVDFERTKANAGESSSATHAATVALHDVETLGNLAKKIIEEPSSIQNLKSIGSIENFQEAKKAFRQALHDYCMQVMWNAVFYEPVASCALAWRKNKRWSPVSTEGAAALDKVCTGVQKTADVKAETIDPGAPADELDCPPGFHLILQDSSMISHSHFREDKLSKPDAQHYKGDTEGIIARVEEELHTSGNASMVDFLKTAVEKEVFKQVKCLADGINEVSAETLGIAYNDNESEDAAIKVIQKPGSEHMCSDEAHILSKGIGSSVQPALSAQMQSSSDFLGFGLRRSGAPSSIAIDYSSIDEPPPPGFFDFTINQFDQDMRKCLLDQFEIPIAAIRSHLAANSAHESRLSDFIGSAFERLGTPVSSVIDDQRSDEPLPESGSYLNDVVLSSTSKFRPLGTGEDIPYQKKLMALALCRKRLHGAVLRDWMSSFHDDLHVKRHARVQEDVIIRSEKLSKSTPSLQSETDLLMERLKSYHSSGPSEVSAIEEFTYSGRKKVPKSSGDEPRSPPLRDFKFNHQSSKKFEESRSSKNVSASGALGIKKLKQKAKGLWQKETESSTMTSKVGAVKNKLSKDRQSTRSLNCRKPQSGTVPAQKYGVERRVPHVETASDSNKEISCCSIRNISKKDKLPAGRSLKIKKSSTTSSLKRKNVVDESLSLSAKALKVVDAGAKQTASKKNGRTKLNKPRVQSSCPVSVGCARTSIDGWKWHEWSLHATPAERVRVRGNKITTMQRSTFDIRGSRPSRVKGISARTNRVKMRNLLAAAEGADLLKTSQLKDLSCLLRAV